MASVPATLTADRLEPTKVRLTWPTDSLSIADHYGIFLEGQAEPMVYPVCNHDPGHHSDTPEWMPQIRYWVGGLTPGATYRFVIKLRSGGLWVTVNPPNYQGGAWSAPSPVCEVTLPAAVPYAVLNAHLVDKSAGSVTLRCAHSDRPESQGTATKYGLFRKAAADASFPAEPLVDNLQPVAVEIGAFVTTTVAAPAVGAYDYCFRAANAHGWGGPSNVIRVTADGGPVDVATFAALKTALAAARPGDIIRATQVLTWNTSDTVARDGAVIDLGGYIHEYTAVTGGTNRVMVSPGAYMSHGFQVRNGVLHKADSLAGVTVYGVFLLGGVDGSTAVDFHMTGGFYSFWKLDSQLGGGPNRHAGFYQTRVEPQSRTTVLDLGPAECQEGVLWGHTHYQAETTGNDTTADGVANELATGFWDVRVPVVEGVNGDGIDLKFLGDYYIEAPKVTRAVRNSIKAWGAKSSRGTCAGARMLANGSNAHFGAGTITITDSQFEGYGYASPEGFRETGAIIWGNGRMDNGLPGYGGVSCHMVNCNIRRRMPEGATYSQSLLTALDGGDGYVLEPYAASVVTFEDSLWYNAGTHATLISSKASYPGNLDLARTPYLLKSQAQAGTWPANHTNSQWLDEDWSDVVFNGTPTVYVTGDTSGLTGEARSGGYAVVDPDGDELTITFALVRPNGSQAAVTAADGTWSFVPDLPGAYTVMVTADDGHGHVVTGTWDLTIEEEPVEPPTGEKRAIALLFAWYKPGTNVGDSDHWYVRDPSTNIVYPAHTDQCPYPVSYMDKSWWKTELRNIKAAGFDLAGVQTYPYTNATIYGFPTLAQAWQELYDAGENPVSLGFFCETSWLAGFDLTSPAYRDSAWFRLNQALAALPPAAWKNAMGENTPFLGFYTPAGNVSNWNAGYFTDLRSRFAAAYGVDPYIAVETAWNTVARPVADAVDAIYGWSTHLAGPVDLTNGAGNGCVNIFVGYERAISQPWHQWDYVRLREDGISGEANPSGTWYDRCWQQAIAQNARVVMAQWNELAEGITLCHTLRFGRTYIDASAAWIQTWKSGADPGEPVTLLHPARVRRIPDATPGRAWKGVASVELDASQAQYGWWSVEGNRGLRMLRGLADARTTWTGGELVSNPAYSPDFAVFDWTSDAWGYGVPATKRYRITVTLTDKPASAGARVYLQYDAQSLTYKTALNATLTIDGVPSTKANGMVDLVGDGKVKTISWELTDARFRREQNAASMFRLVFYFNRPVYVSRVRVDDLTRVTPATDTRRLASASKTTPLRGEPSTKTLREDS